MADPSVNDKPTKRTRKRTSEKSTTKKEMEPTTNETTDEEVETTKEGSITNPTDDDGKESTPDNQTPEYIDSILKSAETNEELFEKLKDTKLVASLIYKLKKYTIDMAKGKVVSPNEGAGKNYDLYTALITVCKNEDYAVFSTHFKIINKVFLLNSDGIFNPVRLSRFDTSWRWGQKTNNTYNQLVEVISLLANPGTRKQHLKKINISNAFPGSPDRVKSNIGRFYK